MLILWDNNRRGLLFRQMSSYRKLNGIAHDIAQKFAVSAQHFAYLASDYNVPIVEINLLTGAISPELFNLQFPVACYGVTLCVKLGA